MAQMVGNLMIDSLLFQLERARNSSVLAGLGLEGTRFGLVTLHRPSSVDDPATFEALRKTLSVITEDLRLVFPVHPRTRLRWPSPPTSLFSKLGSNIARTQKPEGSQSIWMGKPGERCVEAIGQALLQR